MLHAISYKSKLIDMKRVLLILSLLICSITSSFGQRNYAQELINLIQEGKCFEAKEFRAQYADSLPQHDLFFDLMYDLHMSLFFNKPDSFIVYLENLLGNQNNEYLLGPVTGVYYGRLLGAYRDKQQYEAGINVCDRMLNYLNRNPFMFDHDFIQNEMKFAQAVKASFSHSVLNEPRISLKRIPTKEKVKLNESEYIQFKAKYNDITLETLFDTGISHYFFIQEDLANEIGAKVVKMNQDSTQLVNGIPTRVYEAIIDSIDLKGIKLYNIPVLVFKDKFASRLSDSVNPDFKSGAETVFKDRQIMMGLPTMKLIGKLEFDWKNRTLSFPERTGFVGNNDASNFYLIQDNPYLRLKINGLNFVGHLDTGSNSFIYMKFPFYEKNKDCIQLDTMSQKTSFARHTLNGTILNIPCKVSEKLNIRLGEKEINSNNNEVLITNGLTSHINIFDGEMGSLLLKAMGPKVIIDFDNMKIESSN